jgi:hypothetical protein
VCQTACWLAQPVLCALQLLHNSATTPFTHRCQVLYDPQNKLEEIAVVFAYNYYSLVR